VAGWCPLARKRVFRAEKDAEAALSTIWSTPWPGGRRLERRYYPCDHGPHFHLTSKPPRTDQKGQIAS
jgi:hypothetical protein